ncbi:hypothetical protein J6590_002474 [Homalodisca vitripennis]|nr:hypothetical protein J6590_002474 [Homalodisca vitripennis]
MNPDILESRRRARRCVICQRTRVTEPVVKHRRSPIKASVMETTLVRSSSPTHPPPPTTIRACQLARLLALVLARYPSGTGCATYVLRTGDCKIRVDFCYDLIEEDREQSLKRGVQSTFSTFRART